MSLRELPPEQQITSRWRHVRYVPLVILVVCAVAAAAVGFVVSRTQLPPTPEFPESAETPEASRLPDSCHVPVDVPATSPWSGEARPASEAVWAEHAEELAGPVVAGEDGWVFWNDIQNNNFSQAIGRRYLSAAELEQWHAYFADLDARLAAEGIPLYIVIAPAKWAIYGDELPAWTDDVRGPGPLDQLMARGGDLPLVDVRAALQDASTEHQTYSRVNSHWTDYGAYVGWNAIAACIDAAQPGTGLAPYALSGVEIGDDFNEFGDWGFANATPDWTQPVFAEPLPPFTLFANGSEPQEVDGERWTHFNDMPAKTQNSSAGSELSVLLVGDSFGVVMSPYLQQGAETTWQQRHNLDGDPSTRPDIVELARTIRPDVVILEIAQRHLNLPPVP